MPLRARHTKTKAVAVSSSGMTSRTGAFVAVAAGAGGLASREMSKSRVKRLVKSVQAMTQVEMTQSLINCGVLTKGGKLAKRYRS